MIEEVRELLRRIDQIVDSESKRMDDEIDELKKELRELKDSGENFTSIKEQIKDLTLNLDELTYENEDMKKKIKKLSPLEKLSEELKLEVQNLNLQQQGYIFTINVISNWIPSQKENIDVLVALSSSPNHTCTLKELHQKTKIPEVTLKNHILPILADNSLINLNEKEIKLTIREEE